MELTVSPLLRIDKDLLSPDFKQFTPYFRFVPKATMLISEEFRIFAMSL